MAMTLVCLCLPSVFLSLCVCALWVSCWFTLSSGSRSPADYTHPPASHQAHHVAVNIPRFFSHSLPGCSVSYYGSYPSGLPRGFSSLVALSLALQINTSKLHQLLNFTINIFYHNFQLPVSESACGSNIC